MPKLLLKNHNINVTEQRVAIIEALKKMARPVTIEELHCELASAMNKTTLYRSLEVMVQAGIIYQTDFQEGVAYFEYQEPEHHHHHLVCTKCKHKQEIAHCPKLPQKKILEDTGFSVHYHIFEIFGLCKNCQK